MRHACSCAFMFLGASVSQTALLDVTHAASRRTNVQSTDSLHSVTPTPLLAATPSICAHAPAHAQVYIPITELVENSPRCLNVRGRTWERVLTITRQPNTAGDAK